MLFQLFGLVLFSGPTSITDLQLLTLAHCPYQMQTPSKAFFYSPPPLTHTLTPSLDFRTAGNEKDAGQYAIVVFYTIAETQNLYHLYHQKNINCKIEYNCRLHPNDHHCMCFHVLGQGMR